MFSVPLKQYIRVIIKQCTRRKCIFSLKGSTVPAWYDGRRGGISSMSGTELVNIKPGLRVSIVLKIDQRSGKLTEGIVKDILTRSPVHP